MQLALESAFHLGILSAHLLTDPPIFCVQFSHLVLEMNDIAGLTRFLFFERGQVFNIADILSPDLLVLNLDFCVFDLNFNLFLTKLALSFDKFFQLLSVKFFDIFNFDENFLCRVHVLFDLCK